VTAPARAGGRLRVLVVDDHAGFRRRARELLEDGGMDVVGESQDGAACLDAVVALRPDAVILDVRLPGEDGFRVAERLGTLPDPPRVVLVSSVALADHGPRPMAACVRGFIAKDDLSIPALLALVAS
jgi:DNA-binding NarL/FixJ family response regulator